MWKQQTNTSVAYVDFVISAKVKAIEDYDNTEEINCPYSHDRCEQVWLNIRRVMFDVKFLARKPDKYARLRRSI